jgi:hypothetical protein
MEQIKLCSLFLKYSRKSKFFDCASAIVVGRVQRNMGWEVIGVRGLFDREESFRGNLLVRWRRSQPKIDLEERGLGFLISHCETSMWLRKCWVDSMKAMSRFCVDQPKSRNPVALSRQRTKHNVKNTELHVENFGLTNLLFELRLMCASLCAT